MRTDPNLLFAIQAFRLGLIDAIQFTEAFSRWSMLPEKSLADVLIENGWLTTDGRERVETLLREMSQSQRDFLPGDMRGSEKFTPRGVKDPLHLPSSSPFDPTVQ